MKKLIRLILCMMPVFSLLSCIENDLSYPDVAVDFTSFEVEGQKSVTIDKEKGRIDVVMGETADLAAVKVLSYTLSDGAQVLGGMPEVLDLRDSVKLTLKVYEEADEVKENAEDL